MSKQTVDLDAVYRDLLNEMPPVKIGGYEYLQGDALEKLDPVAFRQGALDYIDGLERDGIVETGDDGELVWSES